MNLNFCSYFLSMKNLYKMVLKIYLVIKKRLFVSVNFYIELIIVINFCVIYVRIVYGKVKFILCINCN